MHDCSHMKKIGTLECLLCQELLQSCVYSDSLTSSDGSRAKLLPYTNFYVEVLTQYRIKLLHVEVLTNVRIKLLHIEVLTIFPDKTSTLTKLIKNSPSPIQLQVPHH